MTGLRKLAGLSVIAGMLLSGCVIGGGSSNTYSATFSRAIQNSSTKVSATSTKSGSRTAWIDIVRFLPDGA